MRRFLPLFFMAFLVFFIAVILILIFKKPAKDSKKAVAQPTIVSPKTNPFETKTNPFKNIKTNPFR